jgi:hypothetical protein
MYTQPHPPPRARAQLEEPQAAPSPVMATVDYQAKQKEEAGHSVWASVAASALAAITVLL